MIPKMGDSVIRISVELIYTSALLGTRRECYYRIDGRRRKPGCPSEDDISRTP